MNYPTYRKATYRSGFTMVELLVACTILMVIGALIANVIDITAKVTTRTTSKLDSTRVARDCFDAISEDLRGLVVPYNRESTNSLQLLVNPAGDQLPPEFHNPHSLFMQSAVSRARDHGSLAIVGYFVLRDISTSSPNRTRLQLRRLYVEPSDPTVASDYLIYSQPDTWINEDVIYRFAPISWQSDFDNGQRGWIADGVLGMWVRCLDKFGEPISRDRTGRTLDGTYDSRLGYRTNSFISPENSLPAFIEVGLVCCPPSKVENIHSLPAATSSDPALFYHDIETFRNLVIDQNRNIDGIESFTRTFKIHNAAEF